MSDKTGILGSVDAFHGGRLFGWAWDPDQGDSPVTVDVHLDGQVLLSVVADRYRSDLERAGVGKGFHSFDVEVPQEIRRKRQGVLTVRPRGNGQELARGLVSLAGQTAETAVTEPEPPALPASSSPLSESESLAEEISSFLRPRRALAERGVIHRLAQTEFEGGFPWVQSVPQSIYFETTTLCNLKCVMCPHGNGGMPPFSFNAQVLRENPGFLAGMQRVELQGVGEPLMSPSFWELLDILGARGGIDVSFNSNGTLLRGERLDRLVNSTLTRMNVSLDAVTAETYKRIRGANFDQIVGNLRELIKTRNLAPRSRLKIFSNMTLMRANIEEFPDFVNFSHELGVDGIQIGRLSELSFFYGYRTTKGDWTFDYEKQQLTHCRELAKSMIEEAGRRARKLGMTVHFDGGKQFEL